METNKNLLKKITIDYTENIFFKSNIVKLKQKYLENCENFLIIKTGQKNEKKIVSTIKKISYSLGAILKQNKLGKKFVEVKPNINLLNKFNLKKKKEKLRYHQTNLGGSIHSDGPQLSSPPKYIIMGCSQESTRGGLSVISRADKIYNYLKKNSPSTLKVLENNFLFERRGFHTNKFNTFKKPIFFKKNKKLKFRYLREYIEKGYDIHKLKMKKKQISSLNYLDRLLEKKKFQQRFKLNTGDILIINNNFLAHGRTKFSIKTSKGQRKLYRVWVK